jgi:hypothetical protein
MYGSGRRESLTDAARFPTRVSIKQKFRSKVKLIKKFQVFRSAHNQLTNRQGQVIAFGFTLIPT